MDISAALDATPPATRGAGRCKVGRLLDSVPEDTPRRDELVAAFETPGRTYGPGYRRNIDLVQIAANLGTQTSLRSVSDHRARGCLCYAGGE